jgi:hypothetical protein
MMSYAFGDEKCLCIRESGDVAGCPVHEKNIERFGLKLSRADFDKLGAALDRINEAERAAWRTLI